MRTLGIVMTAAASVLLLAGCSSTAVPAPTVTVTVTATPTAAQGTSAFDTAWAACLEMNATIYPDGIDDSKSGRTFDAEEICYSTVGAQGKAYFTKLFNDPEWVDCYAGHETGTAVGACSPPPED